MGGTVDLFFYVSIKYLKISLSDSQVVKMYLYTITAAEKVEAILK